MDHDQRVKILLQEFFVDFFELFFPTWAKRFDFATLSWLNKEVFPDPPQGQRRTLDLVAKIRARQALTVDPTPSEEWIALVHVEIEHEDSVAPLRPRMLDYYHFLRRQHQLPVLPIGFYLRVGLDGIGHDVYEERFWELPILHFEYLYVGLPALPAEEYVAGDNLLGVALAAMMRIPGNRKAWLAAEALRRIKDCPHNEWRRFLLGEFVQAYLPLDAEQQREYDRMLDTEPYKGVRDMATTWYEKGVEKGHREFLMLQLEERFGPLSDSVQAQVESLSKSQLVDLTRNMIRAQSLRDLGLSGSARHGHDDVV